MLVLLFIVFRNGISYLSMGLLMGPPRTILPNAVLPTLLFFFQHKIFFDNISHFKKYPKYVIFRLISSRNISYKVGITDSINYVVAREKVVR